MIGWHCTTPKKLARYETTAGILPPIRFWCTEETAVAWAKRCGRSIVLQIEVEKAYPLPDHKPAGFAYWSPDFVREWKVIS